MFCAINNIKTNAHLRHFVAKMSKERWIFLISSQTTNGKAVDWRIGPRVETSVTIVQVTVQSIRTRERRRPEVRVIAHIVESTTSIIAVTSRLKWSLYSLPSLIFLRN